MELVQQMFVKLGARYIIVTDTDGLCEAVALLASTHFCALLIPLLFATCLDQGIIDKSSWIAFLGELEEKSK